VFKGSGVKIVPSTEDVEAVFSFLRFLSTDILTSPGTNIQKGLEKAIESFPGGAERKKYIMLFSDGEYHSGDIEAAAEKASSSDISIYTIGAGTAGGGKIPTSDGGHLRDSSGEVVVTRLNEQNLIYLAEKTGGKYYQIEEPALLTELIALSSGFQAQDSPGYRVVNSERYRFFIIIALLGLMLSRVVKVVKWKRYF
jgi:Ca-activated chloride channel family protein